MLDTKELECWKASLRRRAAVYSHFCQPLSADTIITSVFTVMFVSCRDIKYEALELATWCVPVMPSDHIHLPVTLSYRFHPLGSL